jgi:glycosyltransferase 2 family protein
MRGRYSQILDALKSTNASIFIAAFLSFVLAISLASVRLKLIIGIQSIPVTFREALSLTFIGYFFNNFLPTAIGGDVVKAYYLGKKTHHKMSAYTSIFVDRVMGLVTMMLMAFIALLFVKNGIIDRKLKMAVYGVTIASVLVIILATNKTVAKKLSKALFFLKPFEDKLSRAYNVIHQYKNHNVLMIQSFCISIASQVLFYISYGILIFSIGQKIDLVEIFVRTPLVSALSLLPSINGLGLREGSTVMLFGPLIGKTNAFAVSILMLVLLLMISVIGGVVYAFSPQFKVKLNKLEKEEAAI